MPPIFYVFFIQRRLSQLAQPDEFRNRQRAEVNGQQPQQHMSLCHEGPARRQTEDDAGRCRDVVADHDGANKRQAFYHFISKHFNLRSTNSLDASGNFNEDGITIEDKKALYVFGDNGEGLPANSIHGYDKLEAIFKEMKHY